MPNIDEPVTIAGLPILLRWHTPPMEWRMPDGASLTAAAGGVTDLFVNPQGGESVLNAPRLHGPVTGDFMFSARVTVDFRAAFDAGVLLVWGDELHWAKLCFEFSPHGQAMIVSVVNRGTSDDANSFVVKGNQVWLRIARLGPAFAFHASTDGKAWELVRHFSLDFGDSTDIGFEVQSPTGHGCTVTFDDAQFAQTRLAEIRSGE
jgi:regulation of enolase protein 1 (concanavalin A-like superfamily)